MTRQRLLVNGRSLVELDQPDGQVSVWYPPPGMRLLVRKGDHVTATGVVAITYEEIDDDTKAITSVTWEAGPSPTAAQIIDSYARQLARSRPT